MYISQQMQHLHVYTHASVQHTSTQGTCQIELSKDESQTFEYLLRSLGYKYILCWKWRLYIRIKRKWCSMQKFETILLWFNFYINSTTNKKRLFVRHLCVSWLPSLGMCYPLQIILWMWTASNFCSERGILTTTTKIIIMKHS